MSANDTINTDSSHSQSTNATVNADDQTTNQPVGLTAGGIIGITVAILAVIAVTFVLVSLACTLRKKKAETRNLKMLDSITKTDPPDTLKRLPQDPANAWDLSTLRAETMKVLKDDAPFLDDLVNRRIAGELEHEWVADVVQGGMRSVSGCRYPRMEIRRASQLTLLNVFPTKQECLHMSKMSDYYGNTLLLSQAPKRVQFSYHWKAIWQERVGVVLWMGNFVEGALTLMDNYIELFPGDQAIYGLFRVTTMATPRKLEQYDEYRVKVRRKEEERQLIFIHEHVWPMHAATTKPETIANLVRHVQIHQQAQEKMRLPGVLIHGSTGIEKSPAFAALYIGRQMWRTIGKVNLIGIMRYIRVQRWQAFTRPNTVAQVRTVFQAMLSLAEHEPGATTAGGGADHANSLEELSCQRQVEETGRATG